MYISPQNKRVYSSFNPGATAVREQAGIFNRASWGPRLSSQLPSGIRAAHAATRRPRALITCTRLSRAVYSTFPVPWSARPQPEQLRARCDSGSRQLATCAQVPAHLDPDWLPHPSVTEGRAVGIATAWRRVLASMLTADWVIYVEATPTLTGTLLFCSYLFM